MRQQIGHTEDRVGWIVAQRNIDHGAILLGHHAFERERQRDPLIVLDAAVIVRIEQHKIGSFVKRILLQVETRGIDMRTQDVHARFDIVRSDLHEHDRLAVIVDPNLIAWFQRTFFSDRLCEGNIARFACELDSALGGESFGLALRKEALIAFAKFGKFSFILIGIGFPCVFAFHDRPFVLARKQAYSFPCASSTIVLFLRQDASIDSVFASKK